MLLEDHLEFFNLSKDDVPRLPAPYGLELQMSRTTCSMVVDDCSRHLLMALRRVAADIADPATPNSIGWPITGGRPTQRSTRMAKLLLTGHHDGAVRFWDMAGETPPPVVHYVYSEREVALILSNSEWFSYPPFLFSFIAHFKRHWGSSCSSRSPHRQCASKQVSLTSA